MTAEAKQPGERLKYQEGVPICSGPSGCGYPARFHEEGECPDDTACPFCSVEGEEDGGMFRCVLDRCRVATFRPIER